jgi:hypothetical protein
MNSKHVLTTQLLTLGQLPFACLNLYRRIVWSCQAHMLRSGHEGGHEESVKLVLAYCGQAVTREFSERRFAQPWCRDAGRPRLSVAHR